ncbi:MAG: lipopolysaccharide assembly protein LapA domain-containing protein [Rhizomicrobium sp.]
MKPSTYLIGIPVATIAAVIAIANRQSVLFSIDPFSLRHPDANLSTRLPLFVLLLAALLLGLVLGWVSALLSARRRRRRREQKLAGSALPPAPPQSKPPA